MLRTSLYYLYLIGVEPNGNKPRCAHVELDPRGKIRRLLLAEEEKELLPVSSFFKFLLFPLRACSIEAANCLVRTLSFPFKSTRAIASALSFQLEPLLPYPMEEASFGWSLIESSEKGSVVTVAATTKESVIKAEVARCSSTAVFSPQAALSQFLSHFFPGDIPIACLHFSNSETFALLQEGKKLLKAACLSRPLDPLSLSDIGAIKQLVLSLTAKMQKPIFFLCTGLENNEEAASFLADKLDLIPCPLNSLNSLNVPRQDLLKYAVALGTALCPYYSPSWQLKGKEKELLALVKEWKIPLSFSAVASVVLAAALGFSLYMQEVKNFQSAKIKVEAVEKLFTKQGFSLPYDNALIDPEAKLKKLNAYLLTLPKTIPLSTNFPLPSTILKWLSEHSVIESSWSNEETGISLESFRYTIVERPEESRKTKGYKVKVDVEIHSPSNVLARQFHDTLLQPNPFIDAKEEVRWSAKGNLYQTSFFLKREADRRKRAS